MHAKRSSIYSRLSKKTFRRVYYLCVVTRFHYRPAANGSNEHSEKTKMQLSSRKFSRHFYYLHRFSNFTASPRPGPAYGCIIHTHINIPIDFFWHAAHVLLEGNLHLFNCGILFFIHAMRSFIFHRCIEIIKELITTGSRRYILRSAYECVRYARRICQLQCREFILGSDSSFVVVFFFILFSLFYNYSFVQ